MFASPQAEHQRLDPLVGDWTFEMESFMGPDQAPSKTTGKVTTRSLGGLWIITENEMPNPEGGTWRSIMTLGYDPQSGRYLGTFVASMMTFLWTYNGNFDASGRSLVLDTEGPRMDQPGMAKYQDIIELVDNDHWILKSQLLQDDGTWQQFMTSHHRSVK